MGGRRAREKTRHDFAPDELRVLFIGESPPDGGTFFYDADSVLYRATREAFVAAAPTLAREEKFLRAFQRMGCFLEDLSLDPIDKLPRSEKLAAREAAVPDLARRLEGWTPRVVVVVVKGISPQVQKALSNAKIEHAEVEELPFPGRYWYSDYVAGLTGLITRWRRRRLLSSPRQI